MGGLVSALNRKYRKQIADGNFPLCYLCGLPIKKQNEVSQDHISPRCISHRTTEDNLAPVHKVCNQKKGCMTVAEWFNRQIE